MIAVLPQIAAGTIGSFGGASGTSSATATIEIGTDEALKGILLLLSGIA
jgi:hypothetical protein